MRLSINTAGQLCTIHSDEAAALLKQIGTTTTRRASHVEPVDTPEGERWTADLSPLDGPTLGPFETRGEALAAEAEWIDARLHQINR